MKKTAVSSLKTEKISKKFSETFEIAHNLSLQINSSVLIGITGELGAGKTVFAKGFASGLGVKELVNSPTFLGISEYYSGRLPFIHMDFYKKVVPSAYIDSYLKKKSIVLIEWIENFNKLFQEELKIDIRVYIQYLKGSDDNLSENERQIIIEINDKKFDKVPML